MYYLRRFFMQRFTLISLLAMAAFSTAALAQSTDDGSSGGTGSGKGQHHHHHKQKQGGGQGSGGGSTGQ